MLKAIKMHKVIEQSMETMEVLDIIELDRSKERKVPLRTLLLLQTAASDRNLMFINIARTADSSTCSVGFPKNTGKKPETILQTLGSEYVKNTE